MRWEEAQEAWLLAVQAEGRSPYTLKAYREHLAPFARWLGTTGALDVAALTAFHIRRFLVEYALARASQTVRSIFNTVRIWLRFLVREGHWPASPVERVSPPRVPETAKSVYSVGELPSLLKTLEKTRTPLALRDPALVSLLTDTGARASELLALTLDHLQEGDSLLVRRTKGRRPRVLILGIRAAAAKRPSGTTASVAGHGSTREQGGGRYAGGLSDDP